MKKSVFLINFLFLLAVIIMPGKSFAQGIMAPGGTGAWGNLVYGGFGITSPQPYSSDNASIDQTDMIAAFGIGLGNPIEGLGFQLGSSMLNVSEQDLYNFGIKVHRYFGSGTSVAVGIEDLFTFGSGESDDIQSSQYIAVTKDLKYKYLPGTFLSKMKYSVGVGFGRFSELSVYDNQEHNRTNGTYAFGAISYKLTKRFNYHLEWSGVNLNTHR